MTSDNACGFLVHSFEFSTFLTGVRDTARDVTQSAAFKSTASAPSAASFSPPEPPLQLTSLRDRVSRYVKSVSGVGKSAEKGHVEVVNLEVKCGEEAPFITMYRARLKGAS